MKSRRILYIVSILVMSIPSMAQVVSQDSLAVLKKQRQMLEIGKRLNDHKLELAKLENEVEGKVLMISQTAERAQKSADSNKEAANKLGEESQNSKLARKASNSASSAKRDARKARKAVSSLEKIEKQINALKADISDDEQKIAAMQPATNP